MWEPCQILIQCWPLTAHRCVLYSETLLNQIKKEKRNQMHLAIPMHLYEGECNICSLTCTNSSWIITATCRNIGNRAQYESTQPLLSSLQSKAGHFYLSSKTNWIWFLKLSFDAIYQNLAVIIIIWHRTRKQQKVPQRCFVPLSKSSPHSTRMETIPLWFRSFETYSHQELYNHIYCSRNSTFEERSWWNRAVWEELRF